MIAIALADDERRNQFRVGIQCDERPNITKRTHAGRVLVREVFRGKMLWNGLVEVFDLAGHPKAKRCYGWSHPEDNDNKGERFVAVLEIPPVESAQTAVKISIVSDIKAGKITPSNP